MISIILLIFHIKSTRAIIASSPERYFGFFDVVSYMYDTLFFIYNNSFIKDDMMHQSAKHGADPWELSLHYDHHYDNGIDHEPDEQHDHGNSKIDID